MTGGGANRPETAARRRLSAYLLCLFVAFGLYVLVHGFSSGWSFLFLCAAVLVVLALLLAPPVSAAKDYRLASIAAAAATALALFVPLAGLCLDGSPLPAAVSRVTVWPQILVSLFAGRVLAEVSSLRFAAGWTHPLDGGRMATQSMSAAALSGCALTLAFYKAIGGIAIAPERLDPGAIVVRALTGQTVIHVAIVFLFFVTIAAIADAALILADDRMTLARLRRLCRTRMADGGRLTRTEIACLASGPLGRCAHSRTMQFVRDWARQVPARPDEAARSLDGFHKASRRMIRALLSFLPLLGFLGTVIGLTAAIGGLPANFGPEAEGSLDIGASLIGLAVKFETTLLGLTGGLVASWLLALLEKREDELAAESRRLVEVLTDEA